MTHPTAPALTRVQAPKPSQRAARPNSYTRFKAGGRTAASPGWPARPALLGETCAGRTDAYLDFEMAVGYRYELRRGDEVVATGHLTRARPFEVGERALIGAKAGIVRSIEPLLGEQELHLVVQLVRENS